MTESDLAPTARYAKFQNQCNNQKGCHLFQLPPELRFKIFRFIHKSPTPLRPILDVDSNQAFCDYELSAQSFATCQLYYNEARQVLYGENILRINCKVEPESLFPLMCEVFDAFTYLPCVAEDLSAEDDLHSIVRDSGHGAQFEDYYDGLAKIENIDLRIEYAVEDHIFIFCRTLREILRGKNVTCNTVCLWVGLINITDLELQQFEARCFQSLRVLRCRSITFPHLRPDQANQLSTCLESTESIIARVVEEITSNQESPQDAFPVWQNTLDVLASLPEIDGEFFEYSPMKDHSERQQEESSYGYVSRPGDNLLTQLRYAVYAYDELSATKFIATLLEQAASWNERAAANEVAQAKAQFEQKIKAAEADRFRITKELQEVQKEIGRATDH